MKKPLFDVRTVLDGGRPGAVSSRVYELPPGRAHKIAEKERAKFPSAIVEVLPSEINMHPPS